MRYMQNHNTAPVTVTVNGNTYFCSPKCHGMYVLEGDVDAMFQFGFQLASEPVPAEPPPQPELAPESEEESPIPPDAGGSPEATEE